MRPDSTVLSLFLLVGLAVDSFAQQPLYKLNRSYEVQTGLYEIYRTRTATVVMLGNSITYGVNWNELLGRNDVVNRGISADVTEGFLTRMEYVYKLQPKVCCIMGGINDLYAGVPVTDVLRNHVALAESLRTRGIIPIIQSTLYVSPRWRDWREKNVEVEKLNDGLRKYAASKSVEFLDLNVVLSQGKQLQESVTYDGVHLNALGYSRWRDILEPALHKAGAGPSAR